MFEPDYSQEPYFRRNEAWLTLARYAFLLAFALAMLAIVLATWTWLMAYRDGTLPTEEWGRWRSNHGPWKHYPGMVMFDAMTLALFGASASALVATIIQPRWRTGLLCAITGLAFIWAFNWCLFLGD